MKVIFLALMLMCAPVWAHAGEVLWPSMTEEALGTFFLTVRTGDETITTSGIRLEWDRNEEVVYVHTYSGWAYKVNPTGTEFACGPTPIRLSFDGRSPDWVYLDKGQWRKF